MYDNFPFSSEDDIPLNGWLTTYAKLVLLQMDGWTDRWMDRIR